MIIIIRALYRSKAPPAPFTFSNLVNIKHLREREREREREIRQTNGFREKNYGEKKNAYLCLRI